MNKKVEEPIRNNDPTDMTADALLERAREIAQMAAEQTQAIEQQRRLPDELMQALKDSGLLRTHSRRAMTTRSIS